MYLHYEIIFYGRVPLARNKLSVCVVNTNIYFILYGHNSVILPPIDTLQTWLFCISKKKASTNNIPTSDK